MSLAAYEPDHAEAFLVHCQATEHDHGPVDEADPVGCGAAAAVRVNEERGLTGGALLVEAQADVVEVSVHRHEFDPAAVVADRAGGPSRPLTWSVSYWV